MKNRILLEKNLHYRIKCIIFRNNTHQNKLPMKDKTQSAPHPVEVWYRVHYSKHYYPPIKQLKMARTDLKDEVLVRKNMNRIIRQVAYSGIILSLCAAACLFVIAFAGYRMKVEIKDIACFLAFIGLAYLCRMQSKKQVKVRSDFWDSKIDEEQLFKLTAAGRLFVILFFLAFTGVAIIAFYNVKF